MPNKKYRVQDIAADIGVDRSEVIQLLEGAFEGAKKAQTSLTDQEVSYVLEVYSKKHEVKNFDEYFKATAGQKTEKPKAEEKKPAAKKKPVAKKEEAPAEKAENAEKAEEKAEPKTEVKAEVKPEPKPEVKPEPKPEVKPEVKAEAKPEPKTEAKPEVKPEVKPEQKPAAAKPRTENSDKPQANRDGKPGDRPQFNRDNNRNGDRPQNGVRNGDRPQFNRDNNRNGDRPQFNNNRNGDRPQFNNGGKPGDRPQFSRDNRNGDRNSSNRDVRREQVNPLASSKPSMQKPAIDSSKIKVNTPPMQKQKGEAVQRGEQVTKMVDTRGSYVELDKYNERYESIAPATKMSNDSFQRKQKIQQKSQNKGKPFNSKRETEAQKLKRLELERARKQQLKVQIPDEIVVSELATRLKVTATEVIKKLFNLGVMANLNETIDFDTASLVAEDLGAKVEKEVVVTIEERLFEDTPDDPESLQPRSPVVVVMGHVDHGKTSLLDYIRHSSVTSTEAGGITQHIGAYRVQINGRDITFLDTPGHEAFTSMRARGASITDIAILVVAADDGIMPQTVEAINHAKAAGVSIIVAINKMDKEGANPDKIKEELTKYDLVCEEWGGDVICVPVSAKTGAGIENLLEMVCLTADVLELKANPDRLATGAVIEAKLDKGRGPIATVLVQNGTLHTGDVLIAGMAVGRVRVMRDDKGRTVKEAGPSVPVEIMGLADVPSAGDTFAAVEDEKLARELVEKRRHDAKEEQFKAYHQVTLDNLFSSIEEGTVKELPIIVKADVQGSVEAVKQSLEKLSNEEVRVRVIHGAVGAVSESDVMLAAASGAIIVGFNVRPHPSAQDNAKRDGIEIRLYRVIYDAIEDITAAMKGMLAPKFREVDLGRVEVRQVYKITNVGIVAGSYVLDGKVARNGQVRIVRDGIIVGDDKIAGLQRFKDSVKEVAAGYECGISLEKFTDIKVGDIFEAYMMEEYRD
ncbi:MAG: translation initiation factor IF-2 [Oscillospiraceae bacterium]|nr:translation initiation factor IF-2 [Oscillospiraceae bacterium]